MAGKFVEKTNRFYRQKVLHEAGGLLSVKFLLLLAEHKGYKFHKNLDENMFLVQHHSSGKKALFFLAPQNLKIDINRAYSIVNRIKVQRSKMREKASEIIVVARRYSYTAKQVLKKYGYYVYDARGIRKASKRLLVGSASDHDAYKGLKYGLSPPLYNTLRLFGGVFLLASAVLPAMLYGAWHNSGFLLAYPLVLTLIVGGIVSYMKWYMDLTFRDAVLVLIIYSAILNLFTWHIIPTYLL